MMEIFLLILDDKNELLSIFLGLTLALRKKMS